MHIACPLSRSLFIASMHPHEQHAERSCDTVGPAPFLHTLQESLRRYSVVPVVSRELGRDDTLCGYRVPRGSHVVTALKAVHQQWRDPQLWQPERFMPGGEFDQFSEDIRQYMVGFLCACVQ